MNIPIYRRLSELLNNASLTPATEVVERVLEPRVARYTGNVITRIELMPESHQERLVFSIGYPHVMGGKEHHTAHMVKITPSLETEIAVKVTGSNRDNCLIQIEMAFADVLRQPFPFKGQDKAENGGPVRPPCLA
jgi:hypothetical protein